jgi:tetratricopeptide (TPR) repeat protein
MDMISIFKDMLGSLFTGTKGKLVACMLAIAMVCLFIGGVIYERSKDYDINEHTSKAVIAAYEEADWARIVEICNVIYRKRGSVESMTIVYAAALENTGKHEKDLKVLNEQIEVEPNNYYLYQTLGEIHQRKNEFDDAISAYEKVIEMATAYASPYINLGTIYQERNDKEKAIENYLNAIELFADNKYYDEIIEYGAEILKMDENHQRTLLLMQYAYRHKSQHKEALDMGKRLDSFYVASGDDENRIINIDGEGV